MRDGGVPSDTRANTRAVEKEFLLPSDGSFINSLQQTRELGLEIGLHFRPIHWDLNSIPQELDGPAPNEWDFLVV